MARYTGMDAVVQLAPLDAVLGREGRRRHPMFSALLDVDEGRLFVAWINPKTGTDELEAWGGTDEGLEGKDTFDLTSPPATAESTVGRFARLCSAHGEPNGVTRGFVVRGVERWGP